MGLGIPVTYHAVSDVVEAHHSWISGGAVEIPLNRCWSEVTVAHDGTAECSLRQPVSVYSFLKRLLLFWSVCLCICAHACRYQKRTEEGIRSLEAGVAGSCGLADMGRALTPELYCQLMSAVVHRDSIA